jgi:hypothetical protein
MGGSDGLDPHCGDQLMLFGWLASAGFGQGPISCLFFAYIIRWPPASLKPRARSRPEAGLTTTDGRACSRRLEQELP